MHNDTRETRALPNLTISRKITHIRDTGVYILNHVADNVIRSNKHILYDFSGFFKFSFIHFIIDIITFAGLYFFTYL